MVIINLLYYFIVFLVGTVATFTPNNSVIAKLLGIFLAGTSLFFIVSGFHD
jgi:hypothetical protein